MVVIDNIYMPQRQFGQVVTFSEAILEVLTPNLLITTTVVLNLFYYPMKAMLPGIEWNV